MLQDLEEAFVVAATRTPVGKAPRGALRTVRPDDLLGGGDPGGGRSSAIARSGRDRGRCDRLRLSGGRAGHERRAQCRVAGRAARLGGWHHGEPLLLVRSECNRDRGRPDPRGRGPRHAGRRRRIDEHGCRWRATSRRSTRTSSMRTRMWASRSAWALRRKKVAQRWKVSREAQDEFALASHQRAIAAQKAGEFGDEITPFEVVEKVPTWARTSSKPRSAA